MKITGKFAVLILLAALVLLPLQVVQAKGLLNGPIFGENYTLKSGETLNDDLLVFGGSVSIEKDAQVNGTIVLFGGSFTLDGDVSKDVVVMGGAVKLGANAHIHGNLVTRGAPVARDAGAKVDGDVINNPTRPDEPVLPTSSNFPSWDNPFASIFAALLQSAVSALLAMLIALFLPTQMRRVSDGVLTQPFASFGMGLLTLIMFIVAVVALGLFSVFIITLLLTVPLIFIVSVIFTAGCVFGWMSLGAEVGLRIAQIINREWPIPLTVGLGVFLLSLVTSVPGVGGIISTLVGLAGLGAVLATRFGTRPPALPMVPTMVEGNQPAPN
jgi:hypothetical protein